MDMRGKNIAEHNLFGMNVPGMDMSHIVAAPPRTRRRKRQQFEQDFGVDLEESEYEEMRVEREDEGEGGREEEQEQEEEEGEEEEEEEEEEDEEEEESNQDVKDEDEDGDGGGEGEGDRHSEDYAGHDAGNGNNAPTGNGPYSGAYNPIGGASGYVTGFGNPNTGNYAATDDIMHLANLLGIGPNIGNRDHWNSSISSQPADGNAIYMSHVPDIGIAPNNANVFENAEARVPSSPTAFASNPSPYESLYVPTPVGDPAALTTGYPPFADVITSIPHNFRSVYGEIVSLSSGRGIIPTELAEHINSLLQHRLGETFLILNHHNYITSSEFHPESHTKQLFDFQVLSGVVKLVRQWENLEISAADWNGRVHGEILSVAFHVNEDGFKPCHQGVTFRDLRDAKITDRWRTGAAVYNHNPSGAVAFCMILADQGIAFATNQTLQAAGSRYNDDGTNMSVNHIDNKDLWDQPVAVHIATRAPTSNTTTETVTAELADWVAAQFKRLRWLVAKGDSADPALERLWMIMGGGGMPVHITLPVVMVQGKQWDLYFATDPLDGSPQFTHIHKAITIGYTDTIVGCYTVVAALRALGRWIKGEYRTWLLSNALNRAA